MAEKRMYWLQVSKEFFQDKVIKKFRKLPGGDTYAIVALRILLKALDSDYRLYFDGIEKTFAAELALDLEEDPDVVGVVLQALTTYGWLSEESPEVIYAPKSEEMCGSETAAAGRMRALRQREKEKKLPPPQNNKASHCYADVTPSDASVTGSYKNVTLEKEIEKDKESIHPRELKANRTLKGENEAESEEISDGRTDGGVVFLSFGQSLKLREDVIMALIGTYGEDVVAEYANRLDDGISSGRLKSISNQTAFLASMIENAAHSGELNKPAGDLKDVLEAKKAAKHDIPTKCPHCGSKLEGNTCKHCRIQWTKDAAGNVIEIPMPDEKAAGAMVSALDTFLKRGARPKMGGG